MTLNGVVILILNRTPFSVVLKDQEESVFERDETYQGCL